MMAAEASQDAEMKLDLLIQHGIDIKTTTSSGKGLSHMAALKGSLHMLQKSTSISMAVVHRKDCFGNTPLHYAALSESHDSAVIDCVNYIVSLGANVNVENNSRYTPLGSALKSNNKAAVTALIRAGASLPKLSIAHTLTVDQLSVLAELDVIAASRHPVISALKTSSLLQQMTRKNGIEKDQYSEMSKHLEKIASKMLTFGINGVSEVNDQVLHVAVKNDLKQVG